MRRQAAVERTWEKSKKGLNFVAVCVNRQKGAQYGSQEGEKIAECDRLTKEDLDEGRDEGYIYLWQIGSIRIVWVDKKTQEKISVLTTHSEAHLKSQLLGGDAKVGGWKFKARSSESATEQRHLELVWDLNTGKWTEMGVIISILSRQR